MRRTGLCLITAVAVISFSSLLYAKMSDDEWKTFAQAIVPKINSKDPEMRRSAAATLGEADRKEAVEMLLKVMEYCEGVRGPLLKEHGELAEQIENIGASPNAGEKLNKADLCKPIALKMRELEKQMEVEDAVRDACIEALSKVTDATAIEWMTNTAMKSGLWSDRAAVSEALGRCKTPGCGAALCGAYDKEKDERVKCSIVQALTLIASKDCAPTLGKALLDPAWQVRLSALAGLKRVGGKEAVEVIIPAFEKETNLRLKDEFGQTLDNLTGMGYGKDIATWKKWWADNAATFAGPAAKPSGGGSGKAAPGMTAAFFGVPITSDKVVFILDISGSMLEETENLAAKERTIVSGPGGNKKEEEELMSGTKIDVAKFELKKCIKKLNKEVKFNIYFFNDAWSKWQDKMVTADAKTKEEAYSFIDQQSANNQTNLWDPLEDALKSAGMGLQDKNYASALDTIFILSDGAPYPPDVYVNAEDILKKVAEMNALKKVKIHCIGIGKSQSPALLGGLARITGGTYVKR